MKKVIMAGYLTGFVLFNSCITLQYAPHETLVDGYYRTTEPVEGNKNVYLEWMQEDILLHHIQENDNEFVDSIQEETISFPERLQEVDMEDLSLVKPSFDVDLITILFKYRPSEPSLPRQLNSDLSGAIYTGYRRDHFRIGYDKVPTGEYRRQVSHIGYSAGVFTGFGATLVNPWVTSDQISDEYEGVVFSAGVAGLVGVNQFTVGIALGWDRLLDRNRQHWIYQNKPWVGATVGINLN